MSAIFQSGDRPACVDNPELFESEAPEDHFEAKKVCGSCEFIEACETELAETIRTEGYGPHVGPRGTWAGRLLAPDYKGREKVA